MHRVISATLNQGWGFHLQHHFIVCNICNTTLLFVNAKHGHNAPCHLQRSPERARILDDQADS